MIHRTVFQCIKIYVNQKVVDHGANKISFPPSLITVMDVARTLANITNENPLERKI